LNKGEIERIKNLPKNIKKEIIWQNEAIDSIVKSIMKSKAGIWNPNRPLGSFLFLGPTWVGKTELVKVLTKDFYEDSNSLIKIDMSEYADKTSVNKLIGSSAWYVWYEEWWLLTEKVRKKPYSVILFDEIEKWDFDVYNMLLQILEDWVLTDNKWRKVNFKNTIIIMTSNLGSEEFNEKAAQIWFDVSEEKEEKIMQDFTKAKENIKWSLTDYFSPEFVNRIDKVVVFNPLDKKNIKEIVILQIKNLKERLEEKCIELKYDTKVINFITKIVYNPDFWAREVRRFINDNIEDSIAEQIIHNQKKKNFQITIEKNEIIVQ
jgi:ATP-dependent Clp protease ATP-binding subunit ClpC